MIQISGLEDNVRVEIFDINGKLIRSGKIDSEQQDIPVQFGLYFVSLIAPGNVVITRKVVVN
jgi:hypothetical protein